MNHSHDLPSSPAGDADSTGNANLYCALRAGFPADLDRVAIETADGPHAPQHYTWRDLERGSAMIANLLASLALPAGSRVAVQVDKSVEALMLYLGVLRAGFVYLPLNTAYQAGEIAHFVGDAEPAAVVCAPRHFQWVGRIAFQAGTRHVFTLGDDRSGSLLERASHQPDTQVPVVRSADDLGVILYTSGTTGRSKGAMLTHGNMLSNARTLQTYWGWRNSAAPQDWASPSPPPEGVQVARPSRIDLDPGGDVLIHALPIFHIHGLFVAVHGALLNGSPMIWFAKFEPRAVIQRFKQATIFMGVPTMYVRLLAEDTLTRAACENMRLFVSGSAPMPPETFDAWRSRTGHTIVERYGMSETVMLTSNPYHGDPALRRAGSVGLPLPGVQVRVRDAEGRLCAPGEIGGIEVRGPNVFAGYWRLPEKTREEFTDDGWFKTGDVGRFDADGYLAIVGRSKDLVISGGYNVYPAEVEALLNELPGVAESAVVGVPHPDFGEAVIAVVVPRPGVVLQPDELAAALKGRIAGYKQPKRVFIAPKLPRNTMGKVQKALLRQQHQGLFGD